MVWRLIASIDFIEVLQGLIVSGLTLALGAAFVLGRIRKERAFDRRLEWHESTLRVTTKFRYLSSQFRMATEMDTLDKIFAADSPLSRIAAELGDCASELREAVSDAVLFLLRLLSYNFYSQRRRTQCRR